MKLVMNIMLPEATPLLYFSITCHQ